MTKQVFTKAFKLEAVRLLEAGKQPATAIARELGVEPETLGYSSVKEQLRAETDNAVAQGVFGVPTLLIDGQVFWGADALDFARAYLEDPQLLQQPGLLLPEIPMGAVRRNR